MVSDRHLLCGEVGILVEVSVTEQILRNFQIPSNPGGTEHAQTVCTRLFFSAHALEPGNEGRNETACARPMQQIVAAVLPHLAIYR